MRSIPIYILISMLSAAICRSMTLVVSISPQQEAVRSIAGDAAEIIVLVPKGASPETYSPTAGEIRRLSKADMLFSIGAPIEKAVIPKVRQLNDRMTIVDTTARMKHRRMEGGHEHDDHPHGASDPHVWLSVENMIVHAQDVALALSARDAGNAESYISKANEYISRLKKLRAELHETMAPLANEKLLVFHPAFGYFLDEHAIVQIPVEINGHEPTGKHLAKLSKSTDGLKIKVLFIQPQSNKLLAENIAKALGVTVKTLDPLPDEYSSGMRTMARTLIDSLQ